MDNKDLFYMAFDRMIDLAIENNLLKGSEQYQLNYAINSIMVDQQLFKEIVDFIDAEQNKGYNGQYNVRA